MTCSYEQLRDQATGEGAEAWISSDDHAYDGERLREYSRGGTVG